MNNFLNYRLSVVTKLKSNYTKTVRISILMVLICAGISRGNEIAQRFEKLKAQYKTINTFHLRATSVVKVDAKQSGTHFPNVTNYCEYWGEGRKYRINSSAVHPGDPNKSYEIAYDDNRFQVFEKHNSQFSYSKKEQDANPTAPENPLLHPLLFLSNDNDDCPACTLKLADVFEDKIWEQRIADAQAVTPPDKKTGELVVQIPGGFLMKKKFVFHIYFGDSPNYLPVKINRVDIDGNVLASVEIEYDSISKEGQKFHWPKSTRYFVVGDWKSAEMISTVENYQINEELQPDIFTIDFSSAEIVWDNDIGMFLRQRRGFPPATYLSDDLFADPDPKPTTNSDSNVKNSADLSKKGEIIQLPQQKPTEKNDAKPIQAEDKSFSQLSKWSILLILIVVAIVIGIYIVARQKSFLRNNQQDN